MRLPRTMAAVLLTGHGGFEALDYRTDVPVPEPKAGEVLIRVAAAGINNTDINTRIGWYSKGVTDATEGGGAGADAADAGWSGTALTFPRIQGADVCGRIVATGEGVGSSRIGERVLVRIEEIEARLDEGGSRLGEERPHADPQEVGRRHVVDIEDGEIVVRRLLHRLVQGPPLEAAAVALRAACAGVALELLRRQRWRALSRHGHRAVARGDAAGDAE